MHSPDSSIQAAVTRARVSRVIARLRELSEERLEGIEATLFEVAQLRACVPRLRAPLPSVFRELRDLPARVVFREVLAEQFDLL